MAFTRDGQTLIERGDTVRLAAGGPPMVACRVDRINATADILDITCGWISESGQPYEAKYPLESLELVKNVRERGTAAAGQPSER